MRVCSPTSCPAHSYYFMLPWSESKFSRPQALELAPQSPSCSSRFSLPFNCPCRSGGAEPTSCNGPQLAALKRLLTLFLRLLRPLQPLWPLTIWSWSGTGVLASCSPSLGQEQTFPGLPASLMDTGLLLPSAHPSLPLPYGSQKAIWLRSRLTASTGNPLIYHKTAFD